MIWRKAGRCDSILESFIRQPCTLPSSPCHGDAGIIQALQRYIEKSRSHASSFIKNACGETFSLPLVALDFYHALDFWFCFSVLWWGKKKPLFQAICLPPLFMGRDSGYQNIRCSKEIYRSKMSRNQRPIYQSWAQWHWAAAVGLEVWGQLELHSETLSEHKSNHIGGL